MPSKQFARGIFAGFGTIENPFQNPNGMEENLRLIDDHLGPYTRMAPVQPGTAFPNDPVNGEGQIYTDGTWAVFNGDAWRMYPALKGLSFSQLDGSIWINSGSAWRLAGPVRVVDSIEELRNLESEFHARAFVTGYFKSGDGGGGDYFRDLDDQTSNENGCTVIVAHDGVRWKLRDGYQISSKQCGVFPDQSAAWNRQQMQNGINAGFGKFLFECKNTGDIIQIDGLINVPLQMEIESNVRWAGTIQQTAPNQPIFVIGAAASDVTIDKMHLSYRDTPVAGADAIRLNGCFAFAAHYMWISSCWNGVYSVQGGNHEFIGLRIFSYENCAMLLSSAADVNVTQFRFHAGDSVRGRNGGIRLEGPCEACTFSQGDITLGQYGITTQDFGNNSRGAAPYYNRFSQVYFDSAKIYPAYLQSLCDSDFVACWFASAGHDEAVGFGSALANPGAFLSKCIDVRFIGGNFENNGGAGAQIYADCRRISFSAGATFKHNQYSRSVDAEAIQFLPNASNWNVIGCHFERDPDQITYRQRFSVATGAGASQAFNVKDNLLGGCDLNINTSAPTGTFKIADNF
ncbi:hypothetical protein [Burkholderia orbicola]|uniref:hypothetical protein n=1 Tax=Burkholderia orbicola TaxID=2978683 RepID=UPI00264C502B|nr:hypothetical protein [Burkholderia orbicola]MDN7533865.1 hypothetical protein [Burkholderia orbicola]